MPSFVAIDYDKSAPFPSKSSQAAALFRRGVVEPYLIKNNFQRLPANNPQTWSDVAAQITDEVVYICGTGDGAEAAFPGPPNSSVLPPDSYANSNLQSRIIHLLACNTAVNLGPDLVSLGKASAFIGYKGNYYFPDPTTSPDNATFANVFLNCDAQIDYALADGHSVADAMQNALAEFEKQASILDAHNPNLANLLRSNASLLCGPTVDNQYGSANATLTSNGNSS